MLSAIHLCLQEMLSETTCRSWPALSKDLHLLVVFLASSYLDFSQPRGSYGLVCPNAFSTKVYSSVAAHDSFRVLLLRLLDSHSQE